ncbi:MAG: penicillin-binding transpeptidase domain-containing protein [Deltaproteobacteria bacterium]
MNRLRLAPWLLAVFGAFLVLLALPWPFAAAGTDAPGAPALPHDVEPTLPVAAAAAPPAPAQPSSELRLAEATLDRVADRYVAPLGAGRAVLTTVPRLQQRIEKVLADHRVPWAAAVLLEPSTGRVLAMAEHSQSEPGRRGLSLEARAPAASVFKIITSSALLRRGFESGAEVCYHGGQHRVQQRLLADDPRRDLRCLSLASALGKSANVVFAKLADRALNATLLRAEADRFLFNQSIPFAQRIETSRAEIPEEAFALATTAAGFGSVRLSPLHGALVAAIVANGGIFVPPEVVASFTGAVPLPQAESRRVIDASVAAELAAMMRTTVTEGTARRAFRPPRSKSSSLTDLTVAGKTGSLSEQDPFRDYSWFVGFAPAENPKVAFAVVVVNDHSWRVKAPAVARAALEAWGDWQTGRLDRVAEAPRVRARRK